MPSFWSDDAIDGFTLAALACEDPGARLAEPGLASEVAAPVTDRARVLERAPVQERRDWVRRLLAERRRAGAR